MICAAYHFQVREVLEAEDLQTLTSLEEQGKLSCWGQEAVLTSLHHPILVCSKPAQLQPSRDQLCCVQGTILHVLQGKEKTQGDIKSNKWEEVDPWSQEWWFRGQRNQDCARRDNSWRDRVIKGAEGWAGYESWKEWKLKLNKWAMVIRVESRNHLQYQPAKKWFTSPIHPIYLWDSWVSFTNSSLKAMRTPRE